MAGIQRTSSRSGWPSPAKVELADIMRLEDWLVERKEVTYLLTMKGDSMKHAGIILDGDVVVVERGPSPTPGQIVVVAEIDGTVTLKFLRQRSDGTP
jgi:SOS-response transcriptional repressor LexA